MKAKSKHIGTISAVAENTVYRGELTAEHGLSLLLEIDNKSFLIDTGRSNVFLQNMKLMKKNISDVNACIITHGHSDHTGGLEALHQENPEIPIYISEQALLPKYKGDTYIGMPETSSKVLNFEKLTDQITQISEHVCIISSATQHFTQDNAKAKFKVKEHGEMKSDCFADEIYVVILQETSISIISGCSHNGPTNIIESVQKTFGLPVKYFIGGLHLKGERNEARLKHITNYVNSSGIEKIVTCHCTGIDAYSYLKQNCNTNLEYLSTGRSFLIEY